MDDDNTNEMNADDDRHPAAFKVAKSMLEAGDLKANLEEPEMAERFQLVVAMKMKPQEGSEEHPEGGVFSISTLDPKEHLQVLMETTQYFANQIGYPLEMMFLQKEPQQG